MMLMNMFVWVFVLFFFYLEDKSSLVSSSLRKHFFVEALQPLTSRSARGLLSLLLLLLLLTDVSIPQQIRLSSRVLWSSFEEYAHHIQGAQCNVAAASRRYFLLPLNSLFAARSASAEPCRRNVEKRSACMFAQKALSRYSRNRCNCLASVVFPYARGKKTKPTASPVRGWSKRE